MFLLSRPQGLLVFYPGTRSILVPRERKQERPWERVSLSMWLEDIAWIFRNGFQAI